MLKTVKVKKQLRLDELIKYVWDNSVIEKRVFLGNHGQRVVFDNVGGFYPSGYAYSPDSTFTVEVEEKIDYDTIFEEVYRVTKEGYVTSDKNKSINECLDWKDYQTQIFAMIDGKLELIWEAKD